MLLRRFTDFVLQSRLHAMGTAFVIAFVPLIGGIGAVIAALVTLRKGVFEGTVVMCATTVPYLLSVYHYPTTASIEFNIALISVGLIVASNILTWVLATISRRYDNWSFLALPLRGSIKKDISTSIIGKTLVTYA
ncbi:MAG TPA: hypothetical protein VJL60_05765, partial [Gammaproteobacteria bacterium]|nr:hypothetical protein [Gammaproteobacteria bacterium]